jgi:hypothetical protein
VARQKLVRTPQEIKAYAHWATHPVEAVKDWFGVTPDDYQGDILTEMFAGGERFAIKSAHGVGKTTINAWAGWVFLNCFENSRVVATAPTFANLNDQLWPEYAKWHDKMPDKIANQWSISGNHIRHVIKPKLWFAVARTSNKPANLQGFHGTDIMIQCDEASAIPDDVFTVIEGALSEAGEEGRRAILALTGNPNFTAGEFYNAFYKNKGMYSRFTVTGDPDLLKVLGAEQGADLKDHGRIYYAPRVTKKYVSNMERKYGREGAIFDVRVRGVFPRQEDSAVIPLEWAERAQFLDVPSFDRIGDAVDIVVDVARFGGDETVIGEFRRGVPSAKLVTRAKTGTIETLNMIIEKRAKIVAEGNLIGRTIIDEPGVGGGVIDMCRNAGMDVTAYNGGESLKAGKDPDDDCRMFANRRARDWWRARRMFELKQLPIPEDDVLVAQLASVQFQYNSKQKIQIESKMDMRDRLGDDASPDRADVIIMGVAPWYSLVGATNTAIVKDDVITQDEGQGDRWRMVMDL